MLAKGQWDQSTKAEYTCEVSFRKITHGTASVDEGTSVFQRNYALSDPRHDLITSYSYPELYVCILSLQMLILHELSPHKRQILAEKRVWFTSVCIWVTVRLICFRARSQRSGIRTRNRER